MAVDQNNTSQSFPVSFMPSPEPNDLPTAVAVSGPDGGANQMPV